MANWTDGPEYAPLERPAAFETPPAEPLEVPPVAVNPAAGRPAEEPAWQPPQTPTVPLDALAPQSGPPPRDPHLEFATVSSVLSPGAALGSGASGPPGWTPDQPLITSAIGTGSPDTAPMGAVAQVQASNPPSTAAFPPPTGPPPAALNFPPPQTPPTFPQPGTPDWFAPAPQQHWRPQNQAVTFSQIWAGATPGAIIPLVIGALVGPVAIVMLALSAGLAGRVRYRRLAIRRIYAVVGGLVALIGLLSLVFSDFELDSAWSVTSGWAQVACWVLPIVVLVQVAAGIRANEPPERL